MVAPPATFQKKKPIKNVGNLYLKKVNILQWHCGLKNIMCEEHYINKKGVMDPLAC